MEEIMLKKIMQLSVFAVLCAVLTGCHSFNNNHRTVMDYANHFIDSGLKVDVVQPLFPYFNSEIAVSMKISGKEIGIYKYNINVAKQRQRLEQIIEDKCVFVEGMKYPVMVNGTFMLLGYEVNPQRDRIIEVFEAFPN